jgi:hypothetical protein
MASASPNGNLNRRVQSHVSQYLLTGSCSLKTQKCTHHGLAHLFPNTPCFLQWGRTPIWWLRHDAHAARHRLSLADTEKVAATLMFRQKCNFISLAILSDHDTSQSLKWVIRTRTVSAFMCAASTGLLW